MCSALWPKSIESTCILHALHLSYVYNSRNAICVNGYIRQLCVPRPKEAQDFVWEQHGGAHHRYDEYHHAHIQMLDGISHR